MILRNNFFNLKLNARHPGKSQDPETLTKRA